MTHPHGAGVARFFPMPCHDGAYMAEGHKHCPGDWVRFEDYEALRQRLSDSTSIRDALDHVVRVARAGTTPTRRLDWIVKRGQRALDGLPPDSDDRPPENSVLKLKERASELRDEVEDLEADLRAERAYAQRIPVEAAAQYFEMMNELHPGFSRITLDEVIAAMQRRYGSAAQQYEIAALRARAALAKNPNPSGHGKAEPSRDPVGVLAREDSVPVGLGPHDEDTCSRCGWMRVHHSNDGACVIQDSNGCFSRYHDVNTFMDTPVTERLHAALHGLAIVCDQVSELTCITNNHRTCNDPYGKPNGTCTHHVCAAVGCLWKHMDNARVALMDARASHSSFNVTERKDQ